MLKRPGNERRVHSSSYTFHPRAAANSVYGGISMPPLPYHAPWQTRDNLWHWQQHNHPLI